MWELRQDVLDKKNLWHCSKLLQNMFHMLYTSHVFSITLLVENIRNKNLLCPIVITLSLYYHNFKDMNMPMFKQNPTLT